MIQIHGGAFLLAAQLGEPKIFKFIGAPVSLNIGDCHTKHHQAVHQHVVRNIYLHIKQIKSKSGEFREVMLIQQGPGPHVHPHSL